MVLGLGLGLVLALALALALTLILTLPLPLTLQVRAAEQRQKLYLPTSPYISLYLPASPCRCARPSRGRSHICLYLPTSPYISLYLPTSPCISLQVRAAEQRQKQKNADFVKAVSGSGEQAKAMLQARHLVITPIDLVITPIEPIDGCPPPPPHTLSLSLTLPLTLTLTLAMLQGYAPGQYVRVLLEGVPPG